MKTTEIQPVEEPAPAKGLPPSYTDVQEGKVVERVWGLEARLDPNVSFEEFTYWAKVEREMEEEENRQYVEEQGPLTVKKLIKGRFSKGIHHENRKKQERREHENAQNLNESSSGEKTGATLTTNDGSSSRSNAVSDEEWRTAARALRTASWGTIFYMITTDILGWSSCPFVFASLGFGPAIALYVVFGLFAGFSGWILWNVFLALDSSRYPMVNFGDCFFRVFGSKSRHFINLGQSLQLLMNVAVLILGNAQTLAQLANNKICFVVCMVILMVVGMVLGSIRSLQRLGWLTNASVWLNIVSFLIILVACANYGVDYNAVIHSTLIKKIGPVRTFAGPPPDMFQQQATGFAGQFTGVDNLVYSYGGAILFISFMAEMRHPWDFWKGMLCAQLFICIVYIFFGAFVYGHWGQYSISNINNAVEPYGLQLAGNILALITAIIACILYFNIGMKTIYQEVFQEILHFPAITTFRGRLLWYALGPIYWIIAFVVAAAVPNFSGISSLVGAFLILNFTYTFPGILYVGYRCQVDAALPGEGYNPVTGVTIRHDKGWRRWVRGFKKSWAMNVFCTLYFLGGLACSGMGSWAAIESLIEVFGAGGTVATSFGCAVPV
ncbi:uncharacterized protein BO97DRAFT_416218 [Aspergillus homomorphus CBS 101889]|uniref:Amino acid transporter transmembrane domain-containing protein n=1 Tax=Aspergillus homomorphus (strain CBS 101889) TaxID=1450537 RepID=A0A395HTN4_ASPHC|nr:hypothetical protein BO97DRAFT_416218 [Aspergillus homomorphus CBS 101889]RAL10188.1 hypothetical protein BO97DRAFT_416218 [Aspergillus homomorphus CBS 101889]